MTPQRTGVTALLPGDPAQGYEDYFVPAIFAPLADVVVGHAPPRRGDRVLDLACGTGAVARRLAAEVGAGGRVVGVDVNPRMIGVARAQPHPDGAAPVEWREGAAVELDLPDGAVDRVYCQQGLQFFPDQPLALREARRVLVPGGRLVLAVWHGLDRHPLYEALVTAEAPHLEALGVPATRGAAPFSLGDTAALRTLLAGAGFTDVDVVTRSIRARFATPDRFVERTQLAYAAVVPQFTDDPDTFTTYVASVTAAMAPVVDDHVEGDHVVVPMHTQIAVGRA